MEKVIKQSYPITVSKSELDGKTNLSFILSSEKIDRTNDIVKIAGVKLDNYLKNPVVIWNHQSENIPAIGNGRNLRVENGNLVGDIEFHRLTQLSCELADLAEAGVLTAVSIGFIPLEWHDEPIPKGMNVYPNSNSIH